MSEELIKHLNLLLRNEITAIVQYILHSESFQYQGYAKLANKERNEIPDEIGHAQKLLKRILFLKGLPDIGGVETVNTSQSPREMLESDMKLEKSGITDLKNTIVISDKEKDYGTSILLQDILAQEEEHYDWLRKQLHLIEALGLELYLQSQVDHDDDNQEDGDDLKHNHHNHHDHCKKIR